MDAAQIIYLRSIMIKTTFLPWWKILERMLFRYRNNGTGRYKLWLQSESISILKAVLTGAVAGPQCCCL